MSTIEKHGFDAPITFTFLNERTLAATTNISYDRTDSGESLAAMACQRDLVHAVSSPRATRITAAESDSSDLLHHGGTFWETARKLKTVLDPDGIISPGRYLGDA